MNLSLILMVWNTSHLMARTLHTLRSQTYRDFELIVIDDNSEDDVERTIRDNDPGVPVRYYRLEHDMGMRGNTVSLNYGIRKANLEYVMYSTPEIMLPPGALEAAIHTHETRPEEHLFVTIPTHGLSIDIQLIIDDVDWVSDVDSIHKLVERFGEDEWSSRWFYHNFYHGDLRSNTKKDIFGHNQTVCVRRKRWFDTVMPFPYFLDYGSDDPWCCDERRKFGYVDVPLWEHPGYHQWHPRSQYWMAQDKAPMWNRNAHTIDNFLGDPRVPPGGTCEIWDKGKREPMSEKEKIDELHMHKYVVATGFRSKEEQHADTSVELLFGRSR